MTLVSRTGAPRFKTLPGLRGTDVSAYIRDPDGNKLCALHRTPAA